MGHVGTHAASVSLYPKLAYDPRTDFEPIALINGAAIVVAAKKDLPPKDFKEFVAYLKANEAKLNQAHAGVGAVSYITCELLNGIIGIKPVGVPFQGTGPAMNALVGGQVDYMCDQITNVVPQVNGGTIKAYAVATPERSPSLPNVPTSAEGGLPNYQASAWNALFAPKGTPKAIVDKLNAAAAKALDDEKVIARMKELGNDVPKPEQRTPDSSASSSRTRSTSGASSSSRSAENGRFFEVDNGGGGRPPPLSFCGRCRHFPWGAVVFWPAELAGPDRRGQPLRPDHEAISRPA